MLIFAYLVTMQIKSQIAKEHPKATLTLLFMSGAMLQTLLFLCCCGKSSFHLFTLAANITATGILLFMPFIFLSGRWRWAQIVWMFLTALLMLANVWYLRVFEDYMSPLNILLIGSVDSTIASGALAVMHASDFTILLPCILTAAIFAALPSDIRKIKTSCKFRIIITAVCIIAVGGSVLKLHLDYYRYLKSTGYANSLSDFRAIINENLSRQHQVLVRGFAIAQIQELASSLSNSTELDQHDIEQIAVYSGKATGLKTGNNKNIIVIVVESLNSSAVLWEHNGRLAMPLLNSLLSDTSTLAFTEMASIVGEARSADGQFMYHTGMFPLRNEPFVVSNATGPYPSIQRILPDNYTSVEIIGEDATMWHHKETTAAYGFDSIYSDIATGTIPPGISQDDVIFNRACQIISGLRQPFYAMISTMTMHDPYVFATARNSWISSVDSLDRRDANYLERCHEFDHALTQFFKWLKTQSLWENSVIAVVSDHEARQSCLSEILNTGHQFFCLINTSKSGHNTGIISQIDVYPTLLDAAGLYDTVPWRGFGTSLLRAGEPGFALMPDGSVIGNAHSDSILNTQKQQWLLSEKWIRAKNKPSVINELYKCQ